MTAVSHKYHGYVVSKNKNKMALTHECFESVVDTINSATTLEQLLESVTLVIPITMASYHHFAAVGSFDFTGLSQYYAYKMPQSILDYYDTHHQHKTYPGIAATFAKGQFMWLSDMEHEPLVIEAGHSELARETIENFGDGLCMPLYGPNNRCRYMFIAFGIAKTDCKTVMPFLIQALAQMLHVRYCLMVEKMHKQVKLTPREAQVLELISFGKTNTDIGDILKISPNTVAGYVKQIFLKLDVSDRVSAAMRSQTIKIDI